MSDGRILVVEDDPAIAEVLIEVLNKTGYKVTHAENGSDALKFFQNEPFQVVITDLEMPVMDGRALIENIFAIHENTVIIVQSAHNDISMVIDVMKKGVYDYFVKPLNIQDLIIKVRRATEAADLRNLKQIREKEKILRLENQMSWYKWKDKAMGNVDTKDKVKFHKSLFDSLKTNFSQGAGFGIMVTLADMISNSPKNEKNEYIISGEIIDLFLSNIKVTEKALSIFAEIDWVISNPLPLETASLQDLYLLISEIKVEISKYLDIKNLKLLFSDPKISFHNFSLEYNKEYFRKAIKELFMNAMKFSVPDSGIISILEVREDTAVFSVINKAIVDKRGIAGIPQEYQNIIFEPFFRLWDYTFENYETLDYGLGLTLVEKIIEKHNGSVGVNNLLDHSFTQPETKVEFSVSIPLKH